MKLATASLSLTLAAIITALPIAPSTSASVKQPRQGATCTQSCGAELSLVTCPLGQIPVPDPVGTVGSISEVRGGAPVLAWHLSPG
ncbi:hypothetical protein VTK26DRAFT_5672 [Humicola hyalothermophila]